MSHPQWIRVMLMIATVWASGAGADLTVIYDNGHTVSIAPLSDAVVGTTSTAATGQTSAVTGEPGAAEQSVLLPIRSPGLSPGPVTKRPVSLPNNGMIPRPFFLIGADAHSLDWLKAHSERLKPLGAVGMLVQAESVADLEAVARFAQGLPILPAPASDIARALGIEHYPVLISRRGIEQ